jgi:DNA (cytosine-5)-methyltransferase 1
VLRWEHVLGRLVPHPLVPGRSRGVLAPEFVEWMMGAPAGHVTAVPGLTRNDMLKLLGNGVVIQQGVLAVVSLMCRLSAWLDEAA